MLRTTGMQWLQCFRCSSHTLFSSLDSTFLWLHPQFKQYLTYIVCIARSFRDKGASLANISTNLRDNFSQQISGKLSWASMEAMSCFLDKILWLVLGVLQLGFGHMPSPRFHASLEQHGLIGDCACGIRSDRTEYSLISYCLTFPSFP